LIFRYPGSKAKYVNTLRSYLKPLIDVEGKFTDAFVGGGSVLIDVALNFQEVKLHANDLNENIYSFWTYITTEDDISPLLRKLEIIPNVEMFYRLRSTKPETLLDKAFYAIFFNRTTFSGIDKASPIGGREQKSKWSVSCRYNPIKLVASTLKLKKLLTGRLTTSCSSVETTHFSGCVYYDPPYYVKGKQLYSVFMTNNQHLKLSSKLQNENNWVLSYDDCPEIRQMYSWATIENMKVRYSVRGEKEDWKETSELIISP